MLDAHAYVMQVKLCKANTRGVTISWLREEFAQCPEEADEEIVGYYCRAWILHLFACVLFPGTMGDTAS